MDRRGITIANPNSEAERKMAGICLAAMDDLDYRSAELRVVVGPDPSGRSGVEAFAFHDGTLGGIWITPDLVAEPPLRIVWVLSEEVAHRYLNEIHGIAHGGDFLDRFAQEGFAGWFQCHRLLRDGLLSADDIETEEITEHAPSPEFGRSLGKHVGSSLGGSYKSADLLNDWYADPEGEAFKMAVMQAVKNVSVEGTPSQVAVAVAQAHSEARERGC